SPLMFAGLQMLLGGLMLVLYGILAGELPRWQWTFNGIAAMAYLTIFGSCIAYGTYVWLIQHTTPAKLGTIAYVNPVVAVTLGWLVLDEGLAGTRLIGAAVILAGVTMITWRPLRKRTAKPDS
ncbi:MAG: EamA family transporter, partial [Altererythrobacter sp.]|nr:EamA family transporter [Altererythrobacter sp.]